MDTKYDTFNKHVLYQTTVQDPKKELEFFRKIYRNIFSRVPYSIREDFCGTGFISCEWVKMNVENTSVGIDIDDDPLEWGRKNNIMNLSSGDDRVKLYNHNVLVEWDPKQKFDIILSLNYSHFLLNKRTDFVSYLKNVKKNVDKGFYVLDFFGGSKIYSDSSVKRNFGQEKNDHSYEFKAKKLDLLNNFSYCSINFKLGKKKLNNLYNFKFRVYSIPEMIDCFTEAGFNNFRIFIKEYFDEDEDEYSEYFELNFSEGFYTDAERFNGYIFAY
jgi:hypothetical protein